MASAKDNAWADVQANIASSERSKKIILGLSLLVGGVIAYFSFQENSLIILACEIPVFIFAINRCSQITRAADEYWQENWVKNYGDAPNMSDLQSANPDPKNQNKLPRR